MSRDDAPMKPKSTPAIRVRPTKDVAEGAVRLYRMVDKCPKHRTEVCADRQHDAEHGEQGFRELPLTAGDASVRGARVSRDIAAIRREEGGHINKSLLVLGTVIQKLSEAASKGVGTPAHVGMILQQRGTVGNAHVGRHGAGEQPRDEAPGHVR